MKAVTSVLWFLVCWKVVLAIHETSDAEFLDPTPADLTACKFFFNSWAVCDKRFGKRKRCAECDCCDYSLPDQPPRNADCTKKIGSRPDILILPPSIEYLDLSLNYLASDVFTRRFFTHIQNVTYLSLQRNQIAWLDQSVFGELRNLKALNLDYNFIVTTDALGNILSIPGLQCFSSEFQEDKVKSLKNFTSDAVWLDFTDTFEVTILEMKSFCSLQQLRYLYLPLNGIRLTSVTCATRMEKLDLSQNSITKFPKTCIGHGNSLFPNLRVLSLEDNQLSAVEALCLPKLVSLLLKKNKINRWLFNTENLPWVYCFICDEIRPRNISSSRLPFTESEDPVFASKRQYRSKTITVLSVLKYLDLSNNKITRLPTSEFGSDLVIFPTLEILNLSNNAVQSFFRLPYRLPKLKVLDMSKNELKLVSSDSFNGWGFPQLEILRLDHQNSRRTDIQKLSFRNPALKYLGLSENNVRFEEHDPFVNCSNLEELSMSQVKFNAPFPLETLSHCRNLSRLELSGDHMSSIPDGVFDSLKQLRTLVLSNNKLTVITEQTFGRETRHRLSRLDLSQNPFLCSCDLMWFREWFISESALFRNNQSPVTEDYKCVNFPEMNLEEFSVTEQACLLSREMNVVIIFTSSVLIAALTTVSLVFRFRWHIRLVLYEAFKGRDDVGRLQRLQANNFDYDVFVSYASGDQPWVYARLLPQLEGRLRLRLCLHERDFRPGKNIVANIDQCLQSSKKVLMVFSKDFVSSQWCQFELEMCLSHVMDNEDALLVVCIDDVASRDMSAAMMAVLKTTTYIQWEDSDDAVESFWGRLRLALNEVLPEHADPVV